MKNFFALFLNYQFSLFFKINFVLTTLLFILFLLLSPSSTYTFLLSFMGAVSTSATLYIIFFLLFFLWRGLFKKAVIFISATVFIVCDISLIIDFFIYKIYGFHINAMVINILTSPDALDSIQLGVLPIVVFLMLIMFLFIFEFYFAKKTLQLTDDRAKQMNKKVNKLLILPIFIIILIEKFTYGYHDLENDGNVLSKFKVIPLYQPLTFTVFAKKYFGYIPKPKITNKIDKKALLNYPLEPIEIANPKQINIFIFASDAVRNKDVTEETAPNIIAFSKDAYRFTNHRSGGNATRFGIFSLMYGLNSTYWFNFLAATQGTILFDTLKELGYNFNIISSTNTNWPEFKKTAYIEIQKDIHDQFKGKPWQKDTKSSDAFVNFIDLYSEQKPLFSFVFLDSPHGYSFPENENIFHADRDVNYLNISKTSKDIPAIYARYKNAIHYNDKLFGNMIKELKKKDLYDNSIIIYTSDHGEEFYEYGSFGHNSSFSKAQTNSVFIIKLPKNMKAALPKGYPDLLTSHVDIVPTLMKLVGVKTPPSAYSNGKNIFDSNYKRDYAFCANWNHNAIITPSYTYIFSNTPDKMFQNEVRRSDDYKLVKDTTIPAKLLIDVMKENSKFLK